MRATLVLLCASVFGISAASANTAATCSESKDMPMPKTASSQIQSKRKADILKDVNGLVGGSNFSHGDMACKSLCSDEGAEKEKKCLPFCDGFGCPCLKSWKERCELRSCGGCKNCRFTTEWPSCPSRNAHAVTLVIDVSGSMNSNDRIGIIRDIIPDLIQMFLREDDHVALIIFNAKPVVVFPMQEVGENAQELDADIQEVLKAGGMTAIYDTLLKAADVSKTSPTGLSRIILMLSDGVNTAGGASKQDGIQALKSVMDDTKFLSIGLKLDSAAGSVQEELATETGGVFVNAEDTLDGIAEKFVEIANILCEL